MTLIAVTGANGFVGGAVCAELRRRGHAVRAIVRPQADLGLLPAGVATMTVADSGSAAAWTSALDGATSVVHLIARTHAPRARDAEYLATNVGVTRALVAAADACDVAHLVYLSSVKAIAERSSSPLVESSVPAPEDVYGKTKLSAEAVVRTAPVPWAILRPPLVHGPHVRGNLLRLMGAIVRGTPLPLATAHGRRSIVGVANLADAVAAVVERRATSVFHVADGEVPTTRVLAEALGEALGRSVRLLPVPRRPAMVAARLLGRGADAERLFGDLVLDTEHIRNDLGWTPKVELREGLRQMARWYLSGAPATRQPAAG